jgi:hypothetical protein
VPLFRDPARATSPPLTPELVAAAEQALGRPLPAAYLKALREEANGGKLRRGLLSLPDGPFAPGVLVPYLLGVGPGGLPALQALIARWRYPLPQGVLLCSDGPRALLLDPAAGDEPAVVWVDLQRPAGQQGARVARDVAELLGRLVDGSPHPAWTLQPALTLGAVQARLRPAGWVEVERHYGVYRFRDAWGAELRVEPNHERDGGGLHFAEHAECPLVARLVEPGRTGLDSARALDALLAPEGQRVHSPHPAAVALAAARA